MYFLEFLETCTIGWVPFCEEGVGVGKRNTENAFFEFFLRRLSTHPTPGAPYIPRRWRPQPPAHPGRLRRTGSRAGRAKTRAGKYQGRPPPKRWTRCTGLHQILDRPRRDDRTGCGALDCLRNVSDRARPNGQNYCKQKYLFFMCKPLDKRNKIVYNIDSKQTYLHHHKTGGQKP